MKISKLDTSLVGPDFRELSYQLLHKDGYLPDCVRDIKTLTETFSAAMNRCSQPLGAYSGKKLGGFWLLSDIIPGHEATFYSWFWDVDCCTPGLVKSIRLYIEGYADELGLARVVARTPDDKTYGRLLEMCKFKLEGRFRNAWKCGGRLSTLFQYRILFPSRGGAL